MTRQVYIVLVYQDLSNYSFLYIFSRNVIEVIFAWKKQSTVTKNILNIISILGNYNIPLFIFIFFILILLTLKLLEVINR